jgi:transglutaminase-like putative cysteine protease
MKIVLCVLVLAMCVYAGPLCAKDIGTITPQATPIVAVPVGPGSEYLKTVVGAAACVDFALSAFPFLIARVGSSARYHPVITTGGITLIDFFGGIRANIPLAGLFSLTTTGTVGYYRAMDSSGPIGGNLCAGADLGLAYTTAGGLGFGLEGTYRYDRSLTHSVGVSASVSYGFTVRTRYEGPPLIVEDVDLRPIFPVLHQHYDASPLGTVRIRNNRDQEIHNIALSFYVDGYMGDPRTFVSAESLGAGEAKSVPVHALFDSNLLEVLERTKISGRIVSSYTYRGQSYTDEYYETVQVENRNAHTWDDDRKAAAFVTTLDPEVMTFSKIVSSLARQQATGSLNQNLDIAMAMYEALRVYGLGYTADATTPYATMSENPYEIDYLQFPRQTLQYRTGDCDDLTILYVALLETANIETAFILVPGHIYPAISTGLRPDEAQSTFSNPGQFIIDPDGQTAWIPLEITALDYNFTGAWDIGIEEWREAEAQGSAVLLRTHTAWEEYQPVWYRPVTNFEQSYFLDLPDIESVREVYTRTSRRFMEDEVATLTEPILIRIQQNGDQSGRLRNRAGVLFAHFGMYGEATAYFMGVLETNPNSVPAALNMGNIALIAERYEDALALFEQVAAQRPDDPQILLKLIDLYYRLDRSAEAEQHYARLQSIDEELAASNRHLSSERRYDSRAVGFVDLAGRVEWFEDE